MKETPSDASQNPLLGFHGHVLQLTLSRRGRLMTGNTSALTRGGAVLWRNKTSGFGSRHWEGGGEGLPVAQPE